MRQRLIHDSLLDQSWSSGKFVLKSFRLEAVLDDGPQTWFRFFDFFCWTLPLGCIQRQAANRERLGLSNTLSLKNCCMQATRLIIGIPLLAFEHWNATGTQIQPNQLPVWKQTSSAYCRHQAHLNHNVPFGRLCNYDLNLTHRAFATHNVKIVSRSDWQGTGHRKKQIELDENIFCGESVCVLNTVQFTHSCSSVWAACQITMFVAKVAQPWLIDKQWTFVSGPQSGVTNVASFEPDCKGSPVFTTDLRTYI